MTVEVKTNLWPKIRANLSLAHKSHAVIGWPSEKAKTHAQHDPISGMTNVEIAATLNLGRPKIGKEPAIPARPFMAELMRVNTPKYKDAARQAMKMIAEGTMSTKIALEQIGRGAQGDLMQLFSDPASMGYARGSSGGWKMDNAPFTKIQKEKNGNAGNTPLVDSGKLRQSITWVVRMRSANNAYAWDTHTQSKRASRGQA